MFKLKHIKFDINNKVILRWRVRPGKIFPGITFPHEKRNDDFFFVENCKVHNPSA